MTIERIEIMENELDPASERIEFLSASERSKRSIAPEELIKLQASFWDEVNMVRKPIK